MTDIHVRFLQEIILIDPDTEGSVSISVYKDSESEAIIGIDTSYLEHLDRLGELPLVMASPFNKDSTLLLEWESEDEEGEEGPPLVEVFLVEDSQEVGSLCVQHDAITTLDLTGTRLPEVVKLESAEGHYLIGYCLNSAGTRLCFYAPNKEQALQIRRDLSRYIIES